MSAATTSKYKKNAKLGKIYHVATNLVIRSSEDKVVIGRIDKKTDTFIPLDEDDQLEQTLNLCKQNDLKFDETLVSVEEETEEQAEEEAEEEAPETNSKKSTSVESKETSKDYVSEFKTLLEAQNKVMLDFVSKMTTSTPVNSKELETVKQELETTKKRLATCLAALMPQ